MRYIKYNISTGVKRLWSKKAKLSFGSISIGLATRGLGVAVPMVALASKPPVNSTVVVSGNTASAENQPGWLFNRDADTSTPIEFSYNAASIGHSSLFVKPIGATPHNKFIGEYYFLGNVASFNSFKYDFQIAGNGTLTSANQFYLNVYANLPGTSVNNYYQCRFDYVPSAGSTTGFSTFTVDKNTVPVTVASRGGATCPGAADGLAGLPAGSTIRAFAINVGDTSSSDAGLAGYLDNVIVNKSEGVTTFDFEKVNQPQSNKDCNNDGWMQRSSPTFTNVQECRRWVHGYVAGHVWLSGPNQEVELRARNNPEFYSPGNAKTEKVHYINKDYPGVLDYTADVICANVNPATGDARFMYQIPDGYPGLSGLYIVMDATKRWHTPSEFGTANTTDRSTALQWCQTGEGFSPTNYNVTRGWVKVDF